MSDYLQPADVAKLLAVSPRKVRSWCQSGALKAANVNDAQRPRWIILKEDLDAFLRARQQQSKPKVTRRKSIATRYDRY